MNVVTEKREIVGTLKTLMGTYNLLSLQAKKFHPAYAQLVRDADALVFTVLDDERFENVVIVRGDFVVIPLTFPHVIEYEVRREMTKEEEKSNKIHINLDFTNDEWKQDINVTNE